MNGSKYTKVKLKLKALPNLNMNKDKIRCHGGRIFKFKYDGRIRFNMFIFTALIFIIQHTNRQFDSLGMVLEQTVNDIEICCRLRKLSKILSPGPQYTLVVKWLVTYTSFKS